MSTMKPASVADYVSDSESEEKRDRTKKKEDRDSESEEKRDRTKKQEDRDSESEEKRDRTKKKEDRDSESQEKRDRTKKKENRDSESQEKRVRTKKKEDREAMTVVPKPKKKRTRDVEDDDVDYIYEERDKSNTKRKQSNRLWNNEDEIVLLSTMINLGIKGGDSNNFDRLYDHVIKDLHCSTVSKSQLTEKVHRLRKKYKKNLVRGGRDFVCGKHEVELFDLCHQLWENSSLAITAISAPAAGGDGNPKPISDLFCMKCLTKMARVTAKFEWDLDDTEHLQPTDQQILKLMKESQISDFEALQNRLLLVKTIVEEKMKSFQI